LTPRDKRGILYSEEYPVTDEQPVEKKRSKRI